MPDKEDSRIVSNFEINNKENKVIIFINPKIFPAALVNSTASAFKGDNWISVDGDPETDLMVEVKPKKEANLELLAREFNNKLLELSTEDIKVDEKNKDLVSKIRETIKEFIAEEKGRISQHKSRVNQTLPNHRIIAFNQYIIYLLSMRAQTAARPINT